MASIVQRGDVFRAQVSRKGRRITTTHDTRELAEAWAERTEEALAVGPAPRPAAAGPALSFPTVAHMMARYSAEVSPAKGGVVFERIRLLKFAAHPLFADNPASAVDGAAMAEWRDERLTQVSPATVNRELNLISAVFNRAIKEWRVPGLTANPVRAIMRPKTTPARTQRVSDADRDTILAKLGWKPEDARPPATTKEWAAFAFCLALATAMRRGEIQSVTWGNVHLGKRLIHLPKTKNGTARDVPLSSTALALLRLLTPGKPGDRMVPVLYVTLSKAYRTAADAAGLAHVRFHDARREAITAFSKKLANVLELSAVSGHKSLQVLKGYYRPDAGDLADKLG